MKFQDAISRLGQPRKSCLNSWGSFRADPSYEIGPEIRISNKSEEGKFRTEKFDSEVETSDPTMPLSGRGVLCPGREVKETWFEQLVSFESPFPTISKKKQQKQNVDGYSKDFKWENLKSATVK